MKSTTQYYLYINTMTSPPGVKEWPYGKRWIYRFKSNSPHKYRLSIYHRDLRQWIDLGDTNCIPPDFQLLDLNELFLELL